MTTLKALQSAETSLRTMLDNAGRPEPDEINPRDTSIVAVWHDRGVVVEVEVDSDQGDA